MQQPTGNRCQVKNTPYNIVVVSKEKPLRIFSRVVNNANAGNEIHNFFCCGVIEIVPALMPSVAIDPFQP